MDDLKWERRKECNRWKGKDGWPEVGEEEGMQWEERKGGMTQVAEEEENQEEERQGKDGWPEVGDEEGIQEEDGCPELWEEERNGWMTQIWRGGRNARGGKQKMDGPKWERRKEKEKKGWMTQSGRWGKGMQKEERKGWMAQSGRGIRNAMGGKAGTGRG
jgi:hypothetical protein